MLRKLLVACAAFTTMASQAIAQQSWPVTCRAGEGLRLEYSQHLHSMRELPCQHLVGQFQSGCVPGASFDIRPAIPKYAGGSVRVYFRSALQGANFELPRAGECAFLDRPIFDGGRPSYLTVQLEAGADATSILSEFSTDDEGRLSTVHIGQLWGTRGNGAVARFLVERWQARGELFTVYATQDREGLRVTGFEPFADGPR